MKTDQRRASRVHRHTECGKGALGALGWATPARPAVCGRARLRFRLANRPHRQAAVPLPHIAFCNLHALRDMALVTVPAVRNLQVGSSPRSRAPHGCCGCQVRDQPHGRAAGATRTLGEGLLRGAVCAARWLPHQPTQRANCPTQSDRRRGPRDAQPLRPPRGPPRLPSRCRFAWKAAFLNAFFASAALAAVDAPGEGQASCVSRPSLTNAELSTNVRLGKWGWACGAKRDNMA